jgi:REP-associated tyrosine transposase
VQKLRYMHNNPVKRGLVLEAGQWCWSSLRSYLYGEPGAVKVNDTGILLMKVRSSAA